MKEILLILGVGAVAYYLLKDKPYTGEHATNNPINTAPAQGNGPAPGNQGGLGPAGQLINSGLTSNLSGI